MRNAELPVELTPESVAATPINDLVGVEPALLTLLSPLGIDLCCGGLHPLGEALALHGIDAAPVIDAVLATLRTSRTNN